MTNPRNIGGIVFDKDGTLFDFHTTWAAWTLQLLQTLSRTHDVPLQRLADAADFDLGSGRINPSSPLIAASHRICAETLAAAIPGIDIDVLEHDMMIGSADVPLAPPVPLAPFLEGLRDRGLHLGVMTNDTEYGAQAHLSGAGVLGYFDFIAGCDSGHGAKPEPGPLLAFARSAGIEPEQSVMVGDSTHDLIAGQRAGMRTVGVLTGLALQADLMPHADIVLPDIGHIPGWLDN